MNEEKRVLRALLRNNLAAFIEKSFNSVDGSQIYVPSEHIELIADRLRNAMKERSEGLL